MDRFIDSPHRVEDLEFYGFGIDICKGRKPYLAVKYANLSDGFKEVNIKTTQRFHGISQYPVKNNDGSINIGRYTIVKDLSGFFDILDYSGDIVVDKINLAQTAIVLANKLTIKVKTKSTKPAPRSALDSEREASPHFCTIIEAMLPPNP